MEIRQKILQRDDHTCQYCNLKQTIRMQVNHIDGNPKNHSDDNLETICSQCHMITHSGLWSVVFKTLDVYKESKYTQNQIIIITREMRNQAKNDDEIIKFLSLKIRLPWKQDLKYLESKFGFISSRSTQQNKYDGISEEAQLDSLKNRENW